MKARDVPWRRWLMWGLLVLLCGILLDQLAYCKGEDRILLQLRPDVSCADVEMDAIQNENLFALIQAYAWQETTAVVPGGRSQTVDCWQVDIDAVKREQLLDGRSFFPEDREQHFVLVTQDTAAMLFGRLDIVGESLEIEGTMYQVLGVLRSPRRVSERLAYHGKRSILLLRDEREPADWITATLQPGISGDLAFCWLTQHPMLAFSVEDTVDLQVTAGLAGLYARGFLTAYALMLFRMLWTRLHSQRRRLTASLSHLWEVLYPLAFFRRATGRLAFLSTLLVFPPGMLLLTVRWLWKGVEVPPELRPTRLMLGNIREALSSLVDFINRQENVHSFFTLQWPWVRIEILLAGMMGLLVLFWLKKGMLSRKADE